MSVSVRHLTARCPACGAPPRLRQTELLRLTVVQMDAAPDDELLTYQCHKEVRPGVSCAHLYKIRVRHFVEG